MQCQLKTPRDFGPQGFPSAEYDLVQDSSKAEAVFAAGCFWCVEAVFRQLDGVLDVLSGYAGGSAATADYQSVCSGDTDHAEVIKISYNPQQIGYAELLKVFFSVAHDPTQLNRQGNDIGRQYRSAIFYRNEAEYQVADKYIQQLNAEQVFAQPIVTGLEPLTEFYAAEEYHQDYATRNPMQPYIQAVAKPKAAKVNTLFSAHCGS